MLQHLDSISEVVGSACGILSEGHTSSGMRFTKLFLQSVGTESRQDVTS